MPPSRSPRPRHKPPRRSPRLHKLNRPEPTLSTPPSPPSPPDCKFAAAYAYASALKSSQPGLFKVVLSILRSYNTGEIDNRTAIIRIGSLLEGYSGLLGGFKRYLPPGGESVLAINRKVKEEEGPRVPSEIDAVLLLDEQEAEGLSSTRTEDPKVKEEEEIPVPSEIDAVLDFDKHKAEGLSSARTEDSEVEKKERPLMFRETDAALYLKKLEKELECKAPERYTGFLEVMRAYKERWVDELDVEWEVRELLDDYPELLEEFNTFLPRNFGESTVEA